MRPEKAYRLVQTFIDRWNDGNTKEVNNLIPVINKLLKKFQRQERDYPNNMNGYESYGYESKESVENNMMYISDRWKCEFRLRWLLDGIEGGHI